MGGDEKERRAIQPLFRDVRGPASPGKRSTGAVVDGDARAWRFLTRGRRVYGFKQAAARRQGAGSRPNRDAGGAKLCGDTSECLCARRELLAELSLDPVDRVLVGPAVPREAKHPPCPR